MKPPRFDYAAPTSLDEAFSLLGPADIDARLLAGGQSLMPALNLRLATPSLLVDLAHVPGLRGIECSEEGRLVIGAMTRHRDCETSPLLSQRLPMVHAAMPGIAHAAIRSRGTIGGSLAHADPAADWPALCQACDATLQLQSAQGARFVKARDFSVAFFTTALTAGEIITAVHFPPWPSQRRWGLQKFSRRRGDFAIVGVIAVADGARGTVVVYGAEEVPSCTEFEAGISAAAACGLAAQLAEKASPRPDLHASADFRRELVAVLAQRAIEQACR